MYVIRNIFKCKPGKVEQVVNKFKAAHALISDTGIRPRVLVDHIATFWTVVVEVEVEEIDSFVKLMHERASSAEVQAAMSGYMDLVESGYREIFRVA
jgi:hypothetical protein